LRQDKQRAELAEDLVNSGIRLRAAGVPISSSDTVKGRKSWPIWDRINFWGGY
jgi:hypothetical protein